MSESLVFPEVIVSLPTPILVQQIEIRRLWELLVSEDLDVLELRAFHYLDSKQTRVEHFWAEKYDSTDALHRAFEDVALDLNRQYFNVYTPLNRLRSDFHGSAAKDSDIRCRDLLLVDIDRVGDTKQPATDAEIFKARTLADSLASWLSNNGWPDPVQMLSGNGVHVYYRLEDMGNTEQSKDLIKTVLVTLAQRFDTPEVVIDRCVFNASRVTKVPGTIMRKGPETGARPYRMARLLP